MKKLLLLIFACSFCCAEETHFLLYDLNHNQMLIEEGPHCDERYSPCSTFKLCLSLIGFDAGLLIDADTPTWDFKEGYADYLPIWKSPHTPALWMKHSCVWFSQLLTVQLGMQRFQAYLDRLDYGNKDLSGENALTRGWLRGSSLKISPREQLLFLAKMLRGELPISTHAVQMTKEIIFLEDLGLGWQLYGKTGSEGQEDPYFKAGWFIGWIENNTQVLPFVYYLRDMRKTEKFGSFIAKKEAKERLLHFIQSLPQTREHPLE